MSDFLFELLQQNDAEACYFGSDRASGLRAIIAVHNTALGPAAGGVRMWRYGSEREAMADGLRLARAMTYKWAAIGANFGGGKCVVIADAATEKTEELLHALGRFIQSLRGQFLAGTDVGTTVADMDVLKQECDFIVPVSEAQGGSGDSGPATALGVIEGMRACLQARYGSTDLGGRTVAVQGLGSVGKAVVDYLLQAGARVTIADIDRARVERCAVVLAQENCTFHLSLECQRPEDSFGTSLLDCTVQLRNNQITSDSWCVTHRTGIGSFRKSCDALLALGPVETGPLLATSV